MAIPLARIKRTDVVSWSDGEVAHVAAEDVERDPYRVLPDLSESK
jgi:hypothetical protein